MKFTGTTKSGEEVTVVPSATQVAVIGAIATILVAAISAGTSYFTNRDVTGPRDSGDRELKKETQLLEKQKFEFDKKLKEQSQSLELLAKQTGMGELFIGEG
jgi:hypothetical protein